MDQATADSLRAQIDVQARRIEGEWSRELENVWRELHDLRIAVRELRFRIDRMEEQGRAR